MVNYSEDSKRFQALLIDQHSLWKLCLGIRKEEKNLDIYKYSYKEYLKIKSKNLKISLKIQKSGTNSNFSCKVKWEIIFRLYRKQRNLLKKLQGCGYKYSFCTTPCGTKFLLLVSDGDSADYCFFLKLIDFIFKDKETIIRCRFWCKYNIGVFKTQSDIYYGTFLQK